MSLGQHLIKLSLVDIIHRGSEHLYWEVDVEEVPEDDVEEATEDVPEEDVPEEDVPEDIPEDAVEEDVDESIGSLNPTYPLKLELPHMYTSVFELYLSFG